MNRLVRAAVICGALSAALVATAPAYAQSLGCMRMPSTVAQYLGYGYGHGHHAPIVRTPGVRPERTQRMAIAPACYGPLGPAPYEMVGCYGGGCPGGCGDGSCHGGPVGVPMAAPMMAPTPADQYAPQMHGPAMHPLTVASPPMYAPTAVRPAPGYVWR